MRKAPAASGFVRNVAGFVVAQVKDRFRSEGCGPAMSGIIVSAARQLGVESIFTEQVGGGDAAAARLHGRQRGQNPDCRGRDYHRVNPPWRQSERWSRWARRSSARPASPTTASSGLRLCFLPVCAALKLDCVAGPPVADL
ncbi:MAG: hypothetical protein R2912_11580 [Eubacteriales bacterium]